MAPFWDLGAIWGPKGPRKEKRCQKWFGFGLDLNTFWLHFGTWRHFFQSRFSMFFFKVPFSIPSRLLGTNGGQKASKMEPKWSPKGASGYFLGSEKTMVFTAREAYEAVSGRLREAIFCRLRLQTLSGGVPESILADFRRFGVPFGSLFEFIWMQKGSPKVRPKKHQIPRRGRRQGRGPSRLRI